MRLVLMPNPRACGVDGKSGLVRRVISFCVSGLGVAGWVGRLWG